MKMLYKFSRSGHLCSVIMHTLISGVSAVYGITQMQWLHHQCELGGNIGILRCLVGRFRRKLHLKFRIHQTSYLSHVLNAVNIKSQFDVYFTSRETQLNKTKLHMI
jgi:hypothetical protein